MVPAPSLPMARRFRLPLLLLTGLLLAGLVWSALPPGAGCHLLGGALTALPGPGKPTACVIPWDER